MEKIIKKSFANGIFPDISKIRKVKPIYTGGRNVNWTNDVYQKFYKSSFIEQSSAISTVIDLVNNVSKRLDENSYVICYLNSSS